ncbi:G1 family glutamic endopeptidase [Kitasatospora viridis]|uniref:Peptidase A4-like protein n=1 Tax=Kitasatospora viridis TaxID=281105 RepID=A0A561TV66_9ACTN|nr:G1 family glutamic endopeptidase [Kitasatospora viridis]TWF91004.1 peptidase A4-like protein [Kitasatospora viridis]
MLPAAVTALGLATALTLAAAPTAGAAAPTATHPAHHVGRHSGGNSNWAGYAVTGGTFHTVTGNWTVPALNCSATAGDISFWSGLDGWLSTSVEQIGLDAVCTRNHTVQYNPWVEMYPANSVYFTETVKAGDTMTSSVTTDGSGSFTLVLADPTQGWTKTYTESAPGVALSSAEVIVEAIGSRTIPACPDFQQVQFSDVTANGQDFATAGTVAATNLERSGTYLTQDGALTGTAFPVTWLHA